MTKPETQPQTSRRVVSRAVDLRRHHSSTTFVASSLFLAAQPLSTQRGHGGFVRGSKTLSDNQCRLLLRIRMLFRGAKGDYGDNLLFSSSQRNEDLLHATQDRLDLAHQASASTSVPCHQLAIASIFFSPTKRNAAVNRFGIRDPQRSRGLWFLLRLVI